MKIIWLGLLALHFSGPPAKANEPAAEAAEAAAEAVSKVRRARVARVKPEAVLKCDLTFGVLESAGAAEYAANKNIPRANKRSTERPWWSKKRDDLTRRLQTMHEHRYTALAATDTSPMDSYMLAQDAFGKFQKLPEAQRALFPNSIDSIKEKLLTNSGIAGFDPPIGLIEYVESYPKRLKEFVDNTHTWGAQVPAIEDALTKLPRNHNIYLELPYVTVAKDGTPKVAMKTRYFASRVELDLYLKEIKAALKSPAFSRDQVNALETLERYFQQIHTLMMDPKTTQAMKDAVPEDVMAIYNRIGKIYTNTTDLTLKPEYRVPWEAWDNLRKEEFWAEVRAIRDLDIPKLKDKVENDKILNALRTLPPEVVREMGYGKVAEGFGYWGRSRLGTKVVDVVGGATGLAGGTAATYKLGPALMDATQSFFVDEAKERADCAAKSDSDFAACTLELIRKNFPAEITGQELSGKDTILDLKNKIKDPKVQAYVESLTKLRSDIAADEALRRELELAMKDEIKVIQSEKDISSEGYRTKVLQTPDDAVFKLTLLGSEDRKVPSLLQRRFPRAFTAQKSRIAEILSMEPDSTEQNQALDKMSAEGEVYKDLTDFVRTIVKDRADFIKANTPEPGTAAEPAPEENFDMD